MGILNKLLGRTSVAEQEPSPAPSTHISAAYDPTLPEYLLDAGARLDAVGESFYQDALEAAAGGKKEESASLEVTAHLVPEPDNPYDSNAVGVFVLARKVGHLSRRDAAGYHQPLMRIRLEQGANPACKARIRGGWKTEDDEGHFGIVLDVAPAQFILKPGSYALALAQRKPLVLDAYIKYHKLTDWWSSNLTDEERSEVLDSWPLPDEFDDMVLEDGFYTSESQADFLFEIAHRCCQSNRVLANKILDKVVALGGPEDIHRAFAARIQWAYRQRDAEEGALEEAITRCMEHIEASALLAKQLAETTEQLPIHHGFKQLCIIREKQHDFFEAVRLAEMAQQQGWQGDWEKRLERLRKRAAKSS